MIGFTLGAWQGGPQWLALAAAGGLYAWGARRAGSWPPLRSVAFAGALAALALALASGIDPIAHERLSVHMVQHGLITMVAAPLAAWSAPVRLALAVQSGAARRRTGKALHGLRGLGHPLTGLGLFALVAAVTHLPAVYELALRDPAVHAAEHAAFFWSAVALWAPLIGADPLPRRLGPVGRFGVLMAAMGVMTAGGAALAGADTVVYPSYAVAAARLGLDPLADQALAGGIMWVGAMVVMLPPLLALAWRALADEERAQRVRDRRAAPREGPR
ncbi:MAG: cytochrome c oxidase assembly protein [Thermoleophilaceae bacterium]